MFLLQASWEIFVNLKNKPTYFGCFSFFQKAGSCTSLSSTGSNGASSYTEYEENGTINKRQLRKDYQTALQRGQKLQAALELINYNLETSPEQHHYALYKEKQALYAELKRCDEFIKTEDERVS